MADTDRILDAADPRTLPLDLRVIGVWILVTLAAIYLPVVNQTPLRVAAALPFILFIPGYLLIAALFPGGEDLDWIERIALSFGLSIAVVPLIGLALNYTPWGIRLDPIVTALVLFCIAMGVAAHWCRMMLEPEARLSIPVAAVAAGVREEFFSAGRGRLDRALSIILVIAIVAAVATTIYVIAVPKEGEKFTEFYILGEEGMAADYPTDLIVGKSASIIVGIGNHEYRPVTYTVEIRGMDWEFDERTNESWVVSERLLSTVPVTVAHNQTWEEPVSFTVGRPETDRIEFLLWEGDPPPETVSGTDRINASYRDLHLWVDVAPAVR
ncbi:MAG: DUF1616 domain-containing protein [Methanomicrobiales archaeon]